MQQWQLRQLEEEAVSQRKQSLRQHETGISGFADSSRNWKQDKKIDKSPSREQDKAVNVQHQTQQGSAQQHHHKKARKQSHSTPVLSGAQGAAERSSNWFKDKLDKSTKIQQ